MQFRRSRHFSEAFEVGSDDKHISALDADGVALAAIVALRENLKEKDAEIEDLKSLVTQLKSRIDSLATHVANISNQSELQNSPARPPAR